MSPFRIVLSFAIAGLAAYQGMTHPGMSMAWFILAGVAFVAGIWRFMRYQKAKSQSDSGPESRL